MRLNNNGDANSKILPIFDCSWISRFNGEDERLFMGGLYRIRIENIINIENQKGYYKHFKYLYFFDCLVSGSDISELEGLQTANIESMKQLINGDTNNIEDYIVNTFKLFCKQRQQVIINLFYCQAFGGKFIDLFYKMNHKNEIVFNSNIFELFVNLKKFIIYAGQYEKQYPVSIPSLLPILQSKNSSNMNIKILAHNPGWLSKIDKLNMEINKESMVIDYETTNDYYGKKEDCVTIHIKK